MRTWDQNRTFNIPQELRSTNQWVCWAGGARKIPVTATGKNASVSDPSTWLSFEQACEAYSKDENICGIGFVFNGNGITGIDIDNVVKDGVISPETTKLLDSIDSYTEYSPSGNGIHCFIRGNIPSGRGMKNDQIEMYDRGRYFTVTGDIAPQYPVKINHNQQFITAHTSDRAEGAVRCAVGDFLVKHNPSPPQGKMDALREALGRIFDNTLNRRRKDLADQSLSGYDMALANYAKQADFSDQETVDLLVWFRKKHNGKQKHIDYYTRTLLKVNTYNNPTEGDNTEFIKNALNDIPITKILQVGESNPLWYLIGDKTYEIGNTEAFTAYATWKSLVINISGKQINVTKKEWPKFLDIMLSITEKVELTESEVMEVIDTHIEEYIESRQNTPCEEDSEEFQLSFLSRKPFIDKNQNMNITITGIHKWILTEHGINYGTQELASRLKAKGYHAKQISRRSDGARTTRRYWGLLYT